MDRCSTLAVAFLVMNLIEGVASYNPDVVGLAAAASISFILLVVILAFFVVSFTWKEVYAKWMRNRGKVKMSKLYFKKKKETKKRLLSGSTSHAPSEANGKLPAQSVDRDLSNDPKASWVRGWSQTSNVYNNIYEEKDVTMELGEENEDDMFKIETVLVDNEVLDVGPYKTMLSNEQAIHGDIYPEPYIYSTVDRPSSAPSTQAANISQPGVSNEMEEIREGFTLTKGEHVSAFNDAAVRL